MDLLIYYLSTCDTNRKLLKQLPVDKFQLIDIKKYPVSEIHLDKAATFFGSYKALFNKRAQKLKGMVESDKPKTEADFRTFILSDYTILNRPLIKIGEEWFSGSQPQTVTELIKSCALLQI